MIRSPCGGTIATETKKERTHAIGWAAVIIGGLTLLRMAKGAGDPPYGVDASYYYQLARHVLRGEGVVTTVSLYLEGWIAPAKTPIYPLWPLLLGYAGRVVGLARAADMLPRVLYVVDLVLLYFLARAVARRVGALRIIDRWYVPDCAHWIVAIFGLAPRFFGATTHPYTEGLAFAAGFAAFLALERFERTGALWSVGLSGLFAGLAFLARTQMVGVAIGCFLALAWLAVREARMRAGAVVWSVVALATVAPWFVFLGFIPGVTADTLPRVSVPRLVGWTVHPTRMQWLAERVTGLGVMFDPSNAYSYVQSFGVVAFLVPLAAIGALFEALRRLKSRGAFRASPDAGGETRPRSLLVTAVLVAGAFFFFNLLLYHSEVWMPWLFGWRHGLPFIFLIVLAVPWLAARSGRLTPAIAIVLLISVASNARSVLAFVASPDPGLSRGETELVRWLGGQPRTVSVITTNAQVLGAMSDAHFYWTHCQASGETTKAMLRLQAIDYVVMYGHETRCRFVLEAGPMRVVKTFGDPGRRVFVLEPLKTGR